MGLRSFVALPVNKGGTVLRFQYAIDSDADHRLGQANAAVGLSGKDTLLLGIPYSSASLRGDRLGDLNILYRRIIWQDDDTHETTRWGILAGGVAPTDSRRDGAFQLGLVATFYRDRHNIDMDALYRHGTGIRADEGRYDLSWQYRLRPVTYPEWGFASEWYSVIEFNGRWREGSSVDYQLTAGSQWIHHDWVLEGGIVQTFNNDQETRFLISVRFHL